MLFLLTTLVVLRVPVYWHNLLHNINICRLPKSRAPVRIHESHINFVGKCVIPLTLNKRLGIYIHAEGVSRRQKQLQVVIYSGTVLCDISSSSVHFLNRLRSSPLIAP